MHAKHQIFRSIAVLPTLLTVTVCNVQKTRTSTDPRFLLLCRSHVRLFSSSLIFPPYFPTLEYGYLLDFPPIDNGSSVQEFEVK